MKIHRIVVTGGRKFTDSARIEADLRALLPLGLRRVAHGGAAGADRRADTVWRWMHGLTLGTVASSPWAAIQVYFVNPSLDGRDRPAPLRRNVRMLDAELELARAAGERLIVLAYPDPNSRGTWHCIRAAIERDIPVMLWAPHADAMGVVRSVAGRHYLMSDPMRLADSRPVTDVHRFLVAHNKRARSDAHDLLIALADAIFPPFHVRPNEIAISPWHVP